VLGANLGSAINPFLKNIFSNNPASQRLPVGNLINRLTGCFLILPFFPLIVSFPNALGSTPAHAVANFHTLFNIIMALLFFPVLSPLARILNYFFRDSTPVDDPGLPRYLDAKAINTPEIAIANATREALRMADIVEGMLTNIGRMLEKGDRDCSDEILKSDDVLERISRQIKIYIGSLNPQNLKEEDKKRVDEVLTFAINMKYASGIVANALLILGVKKIEQHLTFSQEDWDKMHDILHRVRDNARLAATVFIAREPHLARQLLDEKVALRDNVVQAKYAHFTSLREGQPENIEVSALQLDILSNLKRVNSYFASSALSVLYEQGKISTQILYQDRRG
jgi:phosphate:Na+ symporter